MKQTGSRSQIGWHTGSPYNNVETNYLDLTQDDQYAISLAYEIVDMGEPVDSETFALAQLITKVFDRDD